MIYLKLAIVPLQHGTNKFASQKGIRFGGQRDILPDVKDKTTPTNNPRNWTEQQLRASEGKTNDHSILLYLSLNSF